MALQSFTGQGQWGNASRKFGRALRQAMPLSPVGMRALKARRIDAQGQRFERKKQWMERRGARADRRTIFAQHPAWRKGRVEQSAFQRGLRRLRPVPGMRNEWRGSEIRARFARGHAAFACRNARLEKARMTRRGGALSAKRERLARREPPSLYDRFTFCARCALPRRRAQCPRASRRPPRGLRAAGRPETRCCPPGL